MSESNKKISENPLPSWEAYHHRPSPHKKDDTNQSTTQKRDDGNNKK